MKFTKRHYVLLEIVAEATKPSGAYFVPPRKAVWSPILRDMTLIGGGGDAAMLRNLERGCFIKEVDTPVGRYCYRVTERGRSALSTMYEKP